MSEATAAPAVLFVGSDEDLARHAEVMDELTRHGLQRSTLVWDSLQEVDVPVLLAGVHAVVLLSSRGNEAALTELVEVKHRIPDRPVIVLSSRELVEGGMLLVRAGAYEAIATPCETSVLEKSLFRAIQQTRQGSLNREWSRFVTREHTVMRLRSEDIGFCKVPLDIAERLCEAGLLDQSSKLRLTVAFQEAVVNAHDHGNLELDSAWKEQIDTNGIDHFTRIKSQRLQDPVYAGREVEIEINFNGEDLQLRVKDGGRGYAQSIREAVTLGNGLEVSSGRGLFLMRWGVDAVQFNEAGNEVTLLKRIHRTSGRRLWQ